MGVQPCDEIRARVLDLVNDIESVLDGRNADGCGPMAATSPRVTLPEEAAAVVSLKVLRTVPRAEVGITSAR